VDQAVAWFRLERRSRSGVDGARLCLSAGSRLRARVKGVAHMSHGHVDEIEQRSITASLPKSSSLFEFSGDLKQMIDFCHRAVPFWSFEPRPPRRETRLRFAHSISPRLSPANHEQRL
jgi:hypothetical protein